MKVCCLHKTAHAYVLVTELRFVGGQSRPRNTNKAKIPQKIYGAHFFFCVTNHTVQKIVICLIFFTVTKIYFEQHLGARVKREIF